ncbi:hypothetical protein [Sphingomonas sp. Leaf25]|uniref:hypothetical protein n=1 Tax=Sphingomonas sp. Leaf25 TaxID=1735692 RepID=UPI0006F5C548|nr:hypothetical protein [Sphingomonas sp. Leaf25]KQN00543.1 hypothetical protein ASE78_05510 [Sphingomonas sp. Leaf25]
MRTLIISDRAHRAAAIRALPLHAFHELAVAVSNSEAVMRIFAAPEWDCLGEDGKQWVQGLVRETMAFSVERVL